MTEIATTYDENELGWKSDFMELRGDIYVMVELKEGGRVAVKKKNKETGETPKILVTPKRKKIELRLTGDSKGKFVQFITSAEPKYIRYANV